MDTSFKVWQGYDNRDYKLSGGDFYDLIALYQYLKCSIVKVGNEYIVSVPGSDGEAGDIQVLTEYEEVVDEEV